MVTRSQQEAAVARIAHAVRTPVLDRVAGYLTGEEDSPVSEEEVIAGFKVKDLMELYYNRPIDRRDPIEAKVGDPYSPEGQVITTVWASGNAQIIERITLNLGQTHTTLETKYTFTPRVPIGEFRYQKDDLEKGVNAIDLSLHGYPRMYVQDNSTGNRSDIEEGKMTPPMSVIPVI